MVEYLSGNRIQGSTTSGATDGIGSAADLTLSGTTSYNTGLIGKCLYADFSGTEGTQGTPAGNFFSQARTNNDDFNFIHTAGEAWTINLWVKPTVAENGAIQQVIGNANTYPIGSGFAIMIRDRSTSNEVRKIATIFNNNGSAAYSAYNGVDGDMPNNTNWAMITVRCNGATASGATAIDININGGTSNNDFSTPNGTCTRNSSTATARNATYGLMFGRNLYKAWGSTNAHADPFDGSFDEVSIWNRELTDAECVALYNSGSGAVTTTAVTNLSKLIAYWNFNDNVTNQASPTDEKDDITNVPANTRYEETDTRKIYRRTAGNVTYESDFSGTDDWTDSDSSNTGVNTTTDLIDFTIDSSADTTTYDLTTVSNTAWVLRFKVKWLTKNTNTYATFGISDNTSAPNVSQDIISIQWRHEGASKWYGSQDTDGSAPNGVARDNEVSFDPTTSTDYYFEIVRQTATTYIVRRYSDSTYGTVSDSASGTCASTTQTLRYIKFAGWTDCSATSTAEIDDVKFYNGISSGAKEATWIERGTA